MICSFMSLETPTPGNEGKQPLKAAADQPHAERPADVYDLLAWFEVNKKKLAMAAVVFTLLGFLIATIRYFKQQKELNASGALLELKPTAVPSTNQPPVTSAALLEVAQKHSGTAAGQRAELLAASTLYIEGKYAEAHSSFSKFLTDHQESPWAAMASYGIAASLEAQGKTNEASTAYQSAASAHPNTSVAEDAKLALARIYEARNQPEQALKIYNELMPASANPMMAGGRSEVYTKREALYRQHPHLNTNRPPAMMQQPVISSGTNATLSIPGTNAAAPTLSPAPAASTNK